MNTRIDAGRLVLSAAALGSGLTPIVADWNARHTFAPHWPPHARLHEAIAIISQALFGGMALWLLWRPAASPPERDLAVKAAALIPVLTWGPTLAAMRAPGTSLDNPPTEVYPRLFGVPINLYAMEAPVLLAALGYWLDRRGRSPGARRRVL